MDQAGPKPVTGVFVRGKFGHRHTERIMRGNEGKDQIEVMHLEAKDDQQLPELGRGKEGSS